VASWKETRRQRYAEDPEYRNACLARKRAIIRVTSRRSTNVGAADGRTGTSRNATSIAGPTCGPAMASPRKITTCCRRDRAAPVRSAGANPRKRCASITVMPPARSAACCAGPATARSDFCATTRPWWRRRWPISDRLRLRNFVGWVAEGRTPVFAAIAKPTVWLSANWKIKRCPSPRLSCPRKRASSTHRRRVGYCSDNRGRRLLDSGLARCVRSAGMP
jgi:hypothetical protein